MPAVAQHNAVLAAAQRINITTDFTEVKTSAELDAVFETASERRPDGLLMLTAPLFSIYSKHIAELTLKHRSPAISMFSSFARASNGRKSLEKGRQGILAALGRRLGKAISRR
jgi:hypothetical protein